MGAAVPRQLRIPPAVGPVLARRNAPAARASRAAPCGSRRAGRCRCRSGGSRRRPACGAGSSRPCAPAPSRRRVQAPDPLPQCGPGGVLREAKHCGPSGIAHSRCASSGLRPDTRKSSTWPAALRVVIRAERASVSKQALSRTPCNTASRSRLSFPRRLAALSRARRYRKAAFARSSSSRCVIFGPATVAAVAPGCQGREPPGSRAGSP